MKRNDNIKPINKSIDQLEKSNQRSLIKDTLLVFLPIFALIIAVIVVILSVYEKSEMKLFQNNEKRIVYNKLENIQTEILHVTNDLMILASNSQMEKLWDSDTKDEIIKSLSKDFLNVAVYFKLYDQIRLIDENGMEIIRVNFNNGDPVVVSQDKLQNKQKRYYFYDAFKLNKDEVFVSPLDLNIEHGEIEKPLKPMMRFATPVFDKQGKKRGIVLLNYFGQTITNQIVKHEDQLRENELMLLNSNGYWLKGPSSEYEWGFMYERKDLVFKNVYDDAWDKIKSEESSQFRTQQGMFTFKTIYPLIEGQKSSMGSGKAFFPSKSQLKSKEYFWKIVSYVPSKELYTNRNTLRKFSALLFVFLSISLLYITWKLVKAKHYRIKAQQALKESEEKFRVIVETASDWIWEVDETGKYTYSGPNIVSILGYTEKEIIGKTAFDFMPETEKNRVSKIFQDIIKNNKAINKVENINIHKNGKHVVLETNGLPFFDSNGKLLGYRGIDRDITERKKAEQALKENENRLRELNATKDKFFSIIAHDLKSPFNSMLGFSNLLMKNFDNYDVTKQKDLINIIQKGLKNTFKLLENLLLWSRSQKGSIDFIPESENLYLLCNESIELLEQLAKEKSINIINKVPNNVFIKVDKNMMSTILRNLISNAIKYTHKGGRIIIETCANTNKNKQKYTEVCVKDNGVGIKHEYLSKIFSISENISTGGTENERGTGLGLILCKEFVEKHGGKIWVESEVGVGSKFIFTIPLS